MCSASYRSYLKQDVTSKLLSILMNNFENLFIFSNRSQEQISTWWSLLVRRYDVRGCSGETAHPISVCTKCCIKESVLKGKVKVLDNHNWKLAYFRREKPSKHTFCTHQGSVSIRTACVHLNILLRAFLQARAMNQKVLKINVIFLYIISSVTQIQWVSSFKNIPDLVIL